MRDWLSRALPSLLVLGGALCVGSSLLRATPLTHDHPTHLFKAWHMATQLLPSLRVRGFSHFWVFGFPSDELVPPGEELWVLLFRALTLGQLSWIRTYGLAMLGMLAFSGLSMYRFTRHYFGEIAGVIAGLLVVSDAGEWAQGGWFWAIDWGVWPVTLGVSCLLMALVSLEKLLAVGSARQLAFASVWVAATLLSHQATLLFLPAMVALLLFDHWLRHVGVARLFQGLLACLLGAGLAGFYLVPMLARADLTLDLGAAGTTFEDIGKRLLELKIFNGTWPGLVVFAFVGSVVALRRRVPGVFFLASGTALFIALSTDVLVGDLHLERVMPSLRKIEALRMLMGAKVLWFPLVAYGLSLAFEGVVQLARRARERPGRVFLQLGRRATLAPVLLVVALLPYVVPACNRYRETWVPKHEPSQQVDNLYDLRPLWAYTAELRKQSTEHYRIAYELPRHDHISTLAPVFDGTFMYKVGNTPTQAFTNFPQYSDPRLFRLLSVKYVVSDHPLDEDRYTEERKFGKLTLYRFKDFDPRPFSVLGAGEGELVEFSAERIRVRLRGTDANSRLKLHVSYIDHWRARQNEQSLYIVPATVFGIEDPFLMEVPVRDGEVVFEYARCASDWIGLVLTLSAVPLFALGCYVRRVRPHWLRLASFPRGARRAFAVAAGIAALAVSIRLIERYRTREGLVRKDSLFLKLADGEMKAGGQPCKLDGIFHWSCGRAEVEGKCVSGASGMHLCFTTAANSLEIRTRATGDFVAGTYDVREGSGDLHGWLDGADLGSTVARPSELDQEWVQFDTRRRKPDDSSELRIEVNGSPLHCFDFRVVR